MAVVAVPLVYPEHFDFSNSADYPRWIRRFERFYLASRLSIKPEEYQINALLYAMGYEADDVFALLPLGESERKNMTVWWKLSDNTASGNTTSCLNKLSLIVDVKMTAKAWRLL